MSRTRWLDPWPPLPPDAWLRPRAEHLPFPLDVAGTRLFAIARHGLWHGLHALGLREGDAVLVPAWHHGSEVQAMRQLGLVVRFWAGTERLNPDPDELVELLGERTRALHLIHYLGFPQDGARWRAFCDAHGLLLIEDAAQAWLAARAGAPVGSHGDLAIWSLYKAFGLPDGAALAGRAALAGDAAIGVAPRPGVVEAAALQLRWLAQRVPIHRRPQAVANDPLADLALGDPDSAPAATSAALLPRVVDPGAPGRRRAHYALLLEALGDRVRAPFDELPDGASPWVFPIETDDKAAEIARLAAMGVGALDMWSAPHPALRASAFPDAARRRARTLGLPVHHELRATDLERVIAAARGRRPAATRVAEEDFDAVAEEWRGLQDAVGNPFGTWEWAAAWRDHLAEGELVVHGCRRLDGTIAALLPLEVRREGPLRVARWLGHGPADQLGPVCRPVDRPAAARSLRALARAGEWDLLNAEALPAEAGWERLLDAPVIAREASPRLCLARHGTWEAWLSSRSTNFRNQVRRRERRLAREHELTIRRGGAADIDTVIDLHETRWAGDSTAFAGARAGFHRDFASRAAERGWLRIWLLELDGHPAAAWYGLRFAGREWFYQSGRDPSADGSVGFVLLAHTIREAFADGCSEYRFGLGDEPYKKRFADDDAGVLTTAVAGSPRGRAALAARRSRPAVSRALRAVQARRHAA